VRRGVAHGWLSAWRQSGCRPVTLHGVLPLTRCMLALPRGAGWRRLLHQRARVGLDVVGVQPEQRGHWRHRHERLAGACVALCRHVWTANLQCSGNAHCIGKGCAGLCCLAPQPAVDVCMRATHTTTGPQLGEAAFHDQPPAPDALARRRARHATATQGEQRQQWCVRSSW
jgi:hypothetical protein